MQLCLWWSIFCRTCLSVDCFQLHDWDVVGPRQLRFFNIPLWVVCTFLRRMLASSWSSPPRSSGSSGSSESSDMFRTISRSSSLSSLPCLHLTISFVNAVRGRHKTVDRGQRTRSIEDVMKLHHHHHYSDWILHMQSHFMIHFAIDENCRSEC